jgi:predicted transposase YbfD/YdcC
VGDGPPSGLGVRTAGTDPGRAAPRAGGRWQDAAGFARRHRRADQAGQRLRPRLWAGPHPGRGRRRRRGRSIHRRPGLPARPGRAPGHRRRVALPARARGFLAARGGHYLFTVKANQPTLATALRRLPWATAPGSRRRGRGHGRTESRSIKVIDLDGTDIAQLFPAARRAIKVVRRRIAADGRRSVETVYALTSLDHRAAELGLLAAWLRGHWEIENRVHHVRDVTQREDLSRIRTGNGPQVMAALRNTATNLARLNGYANIATAQRAAAWHPTAITDALKAA